VNPRDFFAELKRRNVIRAVGLYLVGAWLLIQVASTMLPAFDAPTWGAARPYHNPRGLLRPGVNLQLGL
jgi:hypothetical protein